MVYPDSIAMELEIEVGDYLLEVNGHKIGDVFDYRYYMKDEYVLVLISQMEKNGSLKSKRIMTMILVWNLKIVL